MTSIVLCFVGGDLLQNPVVFMFAFLNHVYIEFINYYIYNIYIYTCTYIGFGCPANGGIMVC